MRNADDIQLFRKLCQNIEEKYSSSRLGKEDGFVPEIVLFDYALTGHEDISILNDPDDMSILERSVPIYHLKRILSNSNAITEEEIQPQQFDLNVFEIEKGLNSDNIGCIGGVLTVAYFRNHPCIGIAVTRKSDAHLKGQEAMFVEGMVREQYQFDFSLRGNIENINWNTLLKKAAQNLRKRIELLIQSNKITPSLTQLFKLADGNILNADDEGIFTFDSIYGTRHLPLEGLFIDIPVETRNQAIQDWVGGKRDERNNNSGLLGILVKSAEINIPEVKEAVHKYEMVWAGFKSHFLHRIILSDYSGRENGLEEEQKNLLKKLRTEYFDVNRNDEITKNLCSLKLLFEDARGRKNQINAEELRLTIIFLGTRLWIEHQKGLGQNSNVLSGYSNLPLTKDDFYNVLNPVANATTAEGNNPLRLFMHSSINESTYMETFDIWLSRCKANIPRSDWHIFKFWIRKGEKSIVKSFFLDDLNITGIPDWLM